MKGMFDRKFLIFSGISLVITVGLVVMLYLYWDQPIVNWVDFKNFKRFMVLKAFTYIATAIKFLAALILVGLAIIRTWRSWNAFMVILLAASLSAILGEAVVDALKIIFGRYWASTWVNHNPSLISDSAYGFHFFHVGLAYGSFPSGHTAIVFGAMTVILLKMPKWFPLCIALVALQIIGLVGMNYHFLSDILAGAYIGTMTALFTLKLLILELQTTH